VRPGGACPLLERAVTGATTRGFPLLVYSAFCWEVLLLLLRAGDGGYGRNDARLSSTGVFCLLLGGAVASVTCW
jgi:hypothetical protein